MANKFNPRKYEAAEEAYRILRNNGTAWSNIKKYGGVDSIWKPNSIKGEKIMIRDYKRERVIERCLSMLAKFSGGGSWALTGSQIGVSYMIVGDIDRPVVYGENTSGMRGTFVWEFLNMTASLHAGISRKIELSVTSSDFISRNGTDRSILAKTSGWDQNVVRTLGPDDINTVVNLVRSASSGHNKFTRLVKGMLLYIDLLHSGRQQFIDDLPDVIAYNAQNVVGLFRTSGQSYSWCSKPTSEAYVVLMHLIGLAYPFNVGGIASTGNCTVPADGIKHVVVMSGTRLNTRFACELTPELVWVGLIQYAREMRCLDEIEPALICACSMHENRYFREISLPKVESTIDLIRPFFGPVGSDADPKPMIDKETSIICGRIHQMSMMVMVKDMIIAAVMSTASGMDYRSVIRAYLNSQERVFMRMGDWVSPLSLVGHTGPARWLSVINDEDLADISSISIFEGLWLCSSDVRSTDRGGIELLFKGRHDMGGSGEYLRLLNSEAAAMGIVIDMTRIPNGRYSVRGRCIYPPVEREPRVQEWQTATIENTVACKDFRPAIYKPVRRVRYSRVESDSVSEESAYVVVKPNPVAVESPLPVLAKAEHNVSQQHIKPKVASATVPAWKRRSFSGKKSQELKLSFAAPERRSWSEVAAAAPVVPVVTGRRVPAMQTGNHRELADVASEVAWDSTTIEAARELKKDFRGILTFETDVIATIAGKIVESTGWEQTLRYRQLDPTAVVMGDRAKFIVALMTRHLPWEDIVKVINGLEDSKIKINIARLAAYIRNGGEVVRRQMVQNDSFVQGKLGAGDGFIAHVALADSVIMDGIPVQARNLIAQSFVMSEEEKREFKMANIDDGARTEFIVEQVETNPEIVGYAVDDQPAEKYPLRGHSIGGRFAKE
jgi:hypothetical protein